MEKRIIIRIRSGTGIRLLLVLCPFRKQTKRFLLLPPQNHHRSTSNNRQQTGTAAVVQRHPQPKSNCPEPLPAHRATAAGAARNSRTRPNRTVKFRLKVSKRRTRNNPKAAKIRMILLLRMMWHLLLLLLTITQQRPPIILLVASVARSGSKSWVVIVLRFWRKRAVGAPVIYCKKSLAS